MKLDSALLDAYVEAEIVLDVLGPYIYLGQLVRYDHKYVVLVEADVHDMRDSTSTRERYVLEARQHGITPNRKQVLVSHDQIVSISSLTDVYG